MTTFLEGSVADAIRAIALGSDGFFSFSTIGIGDGACDFSFVAFAFR